MTDKGDIAFPSAALPTIDMVTYYALARNGLDDFEALRNARLQILRHIRNIGDKRFANIVKLMKNNGYGDAPWIAEYEANPLPKGRTPV